MELLPPAEGQDHHTLRGLTIENKIIEIGNGTYQDIIHSSTLINCTLRIRCAADGVNIFDSSLINCTIWPARQMNNLRLTGLELIDCTFKGKYRGCRFGSEHSDQSSNLTGCDFSQARLFDLCDFLDGCDVHSCHFPVWPHLVVTGLPESAPDWLTIDFPQSFRTTQRIIGQQEGPSVAVSVYLPARLERADDYKELLTSRPYLLVPV